MTDPNRKAQKAAAVAYKQEQHDEATGGIHFQPWPKIYRLAREIIITEKIDGTNAAIGVTEDGRVYAQSRNRLISVFDDNAGFAQWVKQHEDVLRDTLGPGVHFGEWWGVGIQRGYGLSERRFSLFNSWKWGIDELGVTKLELARQLGVAIYSVPILYQGEWIQGDDGLFAPAYWLEVLRRNGSRAAVGYPNAEGIVVFHTASSEMFKWTLDGDGHKSR